MHRTILVGLLAFGLGCATNADTTEHVLEHGGRRRTYALHLPTGYATSTAACPLVLVFHGGGGNAGHAEKSTRYSQLADEAGFIVAYPNGTGPLSNALLTWNSAGIPVYAVEHQVDDVGFARALVATLARTHRVDLGRVYATGMSNGGMMVHRLAREASDVFAAVCDVSGAMNFTAADPKHPIGVMMVHGRADQHVPYAGGRPSVEVRGDASERTDTSVDTAIAYYVAHNQLAGTPERKVDGAVAIDRYARTGAGEPARFEVMLVAIEGEGHTWPGSERLRLKADRPTRDVDATRASWEFFARHTR